jgi:hypothetical protein
MGGFLLGEVEVTNEVSLAPSAALYEGAVLADGDLTVAVHSFYYDMGGAKGKYLGSVGNSVVDNTTSYVFVNDSGTLVINTTGYPTSPGDLHVRLARVVASGGFVTRVILERAFFTASSAQVPISRSINTENGLQGGGDLTVDRTLSPVYGSTLNTICQGDDSRLSDDRVASGLRSSTTVVSVSTSTAPSSGQTLVATSSTTATWQSPLTLTSTAPADVTKYPASVGVSTTASRSDHKHNVYTSTASSLAVGGYNSEGTATSLARSDHTHALPSFGSSAGTLCQGNDSRLSDDRISSGIRTATTVVDVSSAPAPSSGQVLTATSSTAATWQSPVSNQIFYKELNAADFDDPGTEWDVTTPAALAADSVNAGLLVRRFDDTTQEGVGWSAFVPSGMGTLRITFISRAQVAPASIRTVGLSLRYRIVPDNGSVGSWFSSPLSDIDIPSSSYFQKDSQIIVSTPLTDSTFCQFELVRQTPTSGTSLTGDWNLLMVVMEVY